MPLCRSLAREYAVEYWICQACIKDLRDIVQKGKTTLHMSAWGWCRFCYLWAWPTHISVKVNQDEMFAIQARPGAQEPSWLLKHFRKALETAKTDLLA